MKPLSRKAMLFLLSLCAPMAPLIAGEARSAQEMHSLAKAKAKVRVFGLGQPKDNELSFEEKQKVLPLENSFRDDVSLKEAAIERALGEQVQKDSGIQAEKSKIDLKSKRSRDKSAPTIKRSAIIVD